MLILNAAEVRSALPMLEAIRSMHEAFTALHRGRAIIPLRSHGDLGGLTMLTMPGMITEPMRVGAKIISIVPTNDARDMPVIQGVVIVFDPDTGAPTCLLDGQSLTALRTGAASGLATDLLASKSAARLAILGSGPQAETQVEAVCTVRRIEEVSVWSRSSANADRFLQRLASGPLADSGVRCRVGKSPADVVRDADVVCCATRATEPILLGEFLQPGAHVNAVGSYTLEMQELDTPLLRDAFVVVDDVEAALSESGELVRAIDAGALLRSELATLGSIVLGQCTRQQERGQITVFKSVGLAVQDLCAAARATAKAQERGIGTKIDL